MPTPSRDSFARLVPRPPDPLPADDAPAVALLTETLRIAAARGASDIHVEPAEHEWRIRLRIDGALHVLHKPPLHLRDAVVTRIKVLARMDIAERRVPQDGRLRLPLANGQLEDYRVNSLPTLFGEKLVLRRLEALPADLSLGALGLDARQSEAVESAIHAPHGLILVTGPTGSGKTLSLYCFLQMLNAEARNVCSVEDPAEIQLNGINQVSVRDKAGLTFAVALRAFMRQDPDVIMVGEIRDAETADVAVKAAQTGHLVLSTLHTNDAPAAIARLIDIGVAPYNLASALRLVTAQRLVRKLCEACRVPSELPLDDGIRPFEPRGCAKCHGIGYRGRVGVHQLMPVTDALRELIVARAATHAVTRQAQSEGMPALRDAAFQRVREGVTSVAEALEATEIA
ncbi:MULTISPECIES: ATPase, T2SS/T4P/T4SS family [unclassified Caballeronia]|uniref:GspE/PulE family protein n=1 Tax=unclassified Caballeronia TaxID=2646786 RepID=UPI002855F220|nr:MULTISPECIES: ATPase, T2SS/T4P/T4SS family [unclassified Caballeronia]MDR5751703.1 ATPase, T2SS/T4P/T4SS family [Caballeronia sp. LZ024]MDR5844157.1 ATPase, T2SS/T4P/T4SS family [Caballeronia sp. LZ031]